MSENTTNTGTSQDARTIVTVLLLIFVYPVGFLIMWFWSRWPLWLKIIISLPVILIMLFIILIVSIGSSREAKSMPSPTPVITQQLSPTVTKSQYVFDIPSLVGKNLDGVITVLGTPKGSDPTAQQIKLGVKQWDKTYTKNGIDLLITYNLSDKSIVDFFVGTTDPSGATTNKRNLLDLTNTTENDKRYQVEFVKVINNPSAFTGIKITPNQ